MWVVVAWMIFVPLVAIGLILNGWKTGQFKDVEEAKYKMLEDRDPEPWPGRKGGGE
jgi:nitrogen fixation-related uncharacterized protein